MIEKAIWQSWQIAIEYSKLVQTQPCCPIRRLLITILANYCLNQETWKGLPQFSGNCSKGNKVTCPTNQSGLDLSKHSQEDSLQHHKWCLPAVVAELQKPSKNILLHETKKDFVGQGNRPTSDTLHAAITKYKLNTASRSWLKWLLI